MKVAKNMDSVFDMATQAELNFDVMFGEDDCLIDLVAGLDESGELITGANPEDTYVYKFNENGDPIEDECDCGRREGDIKTNEDPEGTTKNPDEEFESTEGMENRIPNAAGSAEDKAHDITKEIEDALGESLDMVSEMTFDMLYEADAAANARKALAKKMQNVVRDTLVNDCGVSNVKMGGFFIGGENKKFIEGNSKTWLMAIHCKKNSMSTSRNSDGTYSTGSDNKAELKAIDDVTRAVAKEKDTLIKAIESELGVKVSNMRVADGRMGVTNVSVTLKEVPGSVNENTDIDILLDERSTAKEDICKNCGKPLTECKCSVSESIIASILGKDFFDEEFDPSSETDSTFEDELKGAKEDPITDKDDEEQRTGEDKDNSSNVEGEKQEVIGSALESDDINVELDEIEADTIPDDIQTNAASNNLPKDVDIQANPGIEPAAESAETKPEESQDDKDIEAVDNGDFDSESDVDLQADYDDDELIDMVINGEMN